MEMGINCVSELYPIFNDFLVDNAHSNGKPLKDQNRIDLIWHDLKQAIEVELDAISNEIGISTEKIPWHSVFCNVCKIYRDWRTNIKFEPPRFGHELDPDMIL